jgi:hypothetical protein
MAVSGLLGSRATALGVLASGVVCPCHALVGAVTLVTGEAVLSPAVQDGIHAVYVPFAVFAGALLLRVKTPSAPRSSWLRGGGR